MRELARGDANESQAPRGCRRHLTAGAPPGGGEGGSSSRWQSRTLPIYFGLRVVRLELMFPVFFLPLEVIHCGEIYLWRGGDGATLSGCIS